ncbi:longitudinals lacking protein, isoforms A/B/D/L-like isoform X3 [Anopheles maculipalpis]|uniref:longitudinals lacking protein, isoforms A/B/D/L-like isoform X3 n=1 Tax=Anopheles maculipalpis TaxID=1496333 RepID=UPI0021597E5C|nr:longitudinals lacking protein, isoforms A/B/D/L-like isoform X3 [Anopheles maculipalpis]
MDDDQQFCLRWNNHQSTLISVFDTLLENGTLVDCTLAAEGKFLKAHKVVLSACSPYFATLLSQQYDKHPIFILKDVKFQELRAMMDYMYRGEVNISQDQLAALLKAAESLQIKGLSDNRSSSGSSASGSGGGVHPQQQQKQSDAPSAKSLQPPVPASKGSGLTIENKRSLKSELLESDVSGSREGSTSPTSRKRKKVRRRSVDTNNLIIDNHDQHSNSSSHSMHTGSGANAAVSAVSGTSANVAAASSLSSSSSNAAAGSNSSANVLSVAAVAAAAALKKTETVQQAETLKLQKQQAAAAAAAQSSDDDERCGPGSVATGTEHDDGNDLSDNEHDGDGGSSVKSGSRHHHLRDGSRRGKTSTSSMGEMMIEPKSEYEDVQDENVEDLTMDDEDLMDELDQPGPSHGGDVSSQGYAQWPMDREQNEAFIAAQDAVGGQHRDAQGGMVVPSSSTTTTNSTSSSSSLAAIGGTVAGGRRGATSGSSSSLSESNRRSLLQLNDLLYDVKFSDLSKFLNAVGRYQCPRRDCDKNYKDASSLQRHIRYECGGMKKFRCVMCGKAFSQGSHLKRHLESGVCIKYYF